MKEDTEELIERSMHDHYTDKCEEPGGEGKEPVRHGVNCKKEPHFGTGYLHAEDDDGPYNVDGIYYCGRCHYWIGH